MSVRRGERRPLASLAGAILAMVSVVACTAAPSPTTGPSSTARTAPSVAPSPPSTSTAASAPPSGQRVTIRWEPIPALADFGIGVTHGVAGWVAVAGCDAVACSTVWFSPDGRDWATAELPGEAPSILYRVASGAGGYVVAGPREDGSEAFWQSADGRTWTDAGELEGPDSGWAIDRIALAPSGALVAGTKRFPEQPMGPMVRPAGEAWRILAPAAFGVEAPVFGLLESADSTVLFAANTCETCPMQLWSSNDGETWTSSGAIGSEVVATFTWASSIASRRDGTVVIAGGCRGEDACRDGLLTSVAGGAWTLGYESTEPPQSFQVTWTGAVFLAVSNVGDLLTLASADGVTWTEVENDGLDPAVDSDECHLRLAGGEGLAVLVTDCGSYIADVEVMPST